MSSQQIEFVKQSNQYGNKPYRYIHSCRAGARTRKKNRLVQEYLPVSSATSHIRRTEDTSLIASMCYLRLH